MTERTTRERRREGRSPSSHRDACSDRSLGRDVCPFHHSHAKLSLRSLGLPESSVSQSGTARHSSCAERAPHCRTAVCPSFPPEVPSRWPSTAQASGAPRAEKSASRAQNDARGSRPDVTGLATSDPDARRLVRTFVSAAEPSLMSTLCEASIHDFLNILLIPPPEAKG